MANVCIFCGSSSGEGEYIIKKSRALAKQLALKGHNLVYGGASIGIMGAIAEEFLKVGRDVYGVMPEELMKREISPNNLTELYIVDTMHSRKEAMYKMADCFIALPGGFGTCDELFEILTWRQLGYHDKMIALYNIDNYFDDLLKFMQNAHYKGFVAKQDIGMVLVENEIEGMLKLIEDLATR